MNNNELLSQREAAKYLDISKTTLAKYRNLGYFGKTYETTNAVLFSRKDLDAFAAKYYFHSGKKGLQLRRGNA